MRDFEAKGSNALHRAPKTVAALREAALMFLDSLGADQRSRTVFPFGSDERFVWHYTPVERQGLPLLDMNEDQRRKAIDIMMVGLSPKGFQQAQAIIQHELILKDIEQTAGTLRWDRNPGLYFFSLFGTPSPDEPWSFRIEGHHLSLHFFATDNERFAATPSFFGANPARVPSGPHEGMRIHPIIEDLARELMESLDSNQQSEALVQADAPGDILTVNSKYASIDQVEGIPGAALSADQRELLVRLLEEYIGRKTAEVASRDLHKILNVHGLDNLHFAWAGSLISGQPHYYRIHGPTLLIEYDNVQNDANHIHSVWRDPANDFGLDLLRSHHQQQHIA